MNKSINIVSSVMLAGLILINAGCLTEMLGGAAGGALSASFVGATTDLILHGKVNTDTLARNATSGAIAGGMAGGTYGHQKNKAEKAKNKLAQAPSKADEEATKLLTNKIGKDNVKALEDLMYSNYEDAYKKTLKSVNSKNQDYQETGYIVQALIDTDRKNPKGVDAALTEFVAINDKVDNLKDAKKALNDLYKQLLNMRKIKGI